MNGEHKKPVELPTEEQRVRALIAAELRKRADWLGADSKDGYYVIPKARETECRLIADMIEKGLTP